MSRTYAQRRSSEFEFGLGCFISLVTLSTIWGTRDWPKILVGDSYIDVNKNRAPISLDNILSGLLEVDNFGRWRPLTQFLWAIVIPLLQFDSRKYFAVNCLLLLIVVCFLKALLQQISPGAIIRPWGGVYVFLLPFVVMTSKYHFYYMVSPLGLMELGGTIFLLAAIKLAFRANSFEAKPVPLRLVFNSALLVTIAGSFHERFMIGGIVILVIFLRIPNLRKRILIFPEVLGAFFLYFSIREVLTGSFGGVAAGSTNDLGIHVLKVVPWNLVAATGLLLNFFDDAQINTFDLSGNPILDQWLSPTSSLNLLKGLSLVTLVVLGGLTQLKDQRIPGKDFQIFVIPLFVLSASSAIVGATNENRVESRWFFTSFLALVILLSPHVGLIRTRISVLITALLVFSSLGSTGAYVHDYSQRIRWVDAINRIDQHTSGESVWQLSVVDRWQDRNHLLWITRDGDIWFEFLQNPPISVQTGKSKCTNQNLPCYSLILNQFDLSLVRTEEKTMHNEVPK
jgi:hypothetical protein